MSEHEILDAITLPAASAISRAEIDAQVATAKRFPRDLLRFRKETTELATMDQETAGTMFYTLVRDGKTIEGPSIRMAEIVAFAYGNLRAGARVVEIGERELRAQGFAFDLERNTAATIEVSRRITGRDGRRYSDDMITLTGNAACSIALRNAIFRIVPQAFVRDAYERAKAMAADAGGGTLDLDDRQQRALKYFTRAGLSQAEMLAFVKREAVEKITEDDLVTLRGLRTALEDGDTTVEDLRREAAALTQEKPKPAREPDRGGVKVGEVTPPTETARPQRTGESGAPVAREALPFAPPAAKAAAVPKPRLCPHGVAITHPDPGVAESSDCAECCLPPQVPEGMRKADLIAEIRSHYERLGLKKPVFEFLAGKHAGVPLAAVKADEMWTALGEATVARLETLCAAMAKLGPRPAEPPPAAA